PIIAGKVYLPERGGRFFDAISPGTLSQENEVALVLHQPGKRDVFQDRHALVELDHDIVAGLMQLEVMDALLMAEELELVDADLEVLDHVLARRQRCAAGEPAQRRSGREVKDIRAGAADQNIVAETAVDWTVAAAAVNDIAAAATRQAIGVVIAHERVVELRAGDVLEVDDLVALGVAELHHAGREVDRHPGLRAGITQRVVAGTTIEAVAVGAAG